MNWGSGEEGAFWGSDSNSSNSISHQSPPHLSQKSYNFQVSKLATIFQLTHAFFRAHLLIHGVGFCVEYSRESQQHFFSAHFLLFLTLIFNCAFFLNWD